MNTYLHKAIIKYCFRCHEIEIQFQYICKFTWSSSFCSYLDRLWGHGWRSWEKVGKGVKRRRDGNRKMIGMAERSRRESMVEGGRGGRGREGGESGRTQFIHIYDRFLYQMKIKKNIKKSVHYSLLSAKQTCRSWSCLSVSPFVSQQCRKQRKDDFVTSWNDDWDDQDDQDDMMKAASQTIDYMVYFSLNLT